MSREATQVSGVRWFDLLLALLVILVSGVVYGMFLCREAYPGTPADLIVSCSGLFPKMTPLNPLWHVLIRISSKLAFLGTPLAVNILGAVLSAISVGLVYLIVETIVTSLGKGHTRHVRRVAIAARLAGLLAAFALAFCVPFWAIATRGHPATLHAMMMLLSTWFVLGFLRTPKATRLAIAAFLCGVGALESPAFIVAGPIFAAVVCCYLLIYDRIRTKLVVPAAFCGIAAVCLSLVVGWAFAGSDGYHFSGYASYFKVIRFFWLAQLNLLRSSLPKIGWLMILITSAVPGITALSMARDTLGEEKSESFYIRAREWSYPILHLILTAVTVACLWNVNSLAPWRITGVDRAMLMPPLLICLTFGYLVAYWFLLPTSWWLATQRPFKVWTRRYFGYVLAFPFVALVLVMPFRNSVPADSRHGDIATVFAEEIVDCLDGQEWLITNGAVDNQLRVVADRKGRRLHLLDLGRARDRGFMAYVESLLTTDREKNIVRLGPTLLVQNWIRNNASFAERTAFLVAPELLENAGLAAIPRKLVFVAAKSVDSIGFDALLADHDSFWANFPTRLDSIGSPSRESSRIYQHALRHASMVANQLAVLAEDTGRTAEAYRIYHEAKGICTNNISVLSNLLSLAPVHGKESDEESLREEMRKAVSGLRGRPDILSVNRFYGTVRRPAAFLALARTQAFADRIDGATASMEKAVAAANADRRILLQHGLADTYLMADDTEKVEAVYRNILEKSPSDAGALVGLASITARKGYFDEATELLNKARASGAPEHHITLEKAIIACMHSKPAAARPLLRKLVKEHPAYLRAWVVLAGVNEMQNDTEGMQECLDKVRVLKRDSFHAEIIQARINIRRGEWEAAEEPLLKALLTRPNNARILEQMVLVQLTLDRSVALDTYVTRLLRSDPENFFGNHLRGRLQYKRRELGMAEDSFRKALTTRRSAKILNDLAWVLQEGGNLSEAEVLTRETVTLEPDGHHAWDTLGVILFKSGELDEARQAFGECLRISPNHTGALLRTTDILITQGDRRTAAITVRRLEDMRETLSARDVKDLAAIKERLGEL
ncbi:MAG: tetratricopeptide repeat protein [Kiritimatiellia bacterium]|nr:tetratricopeptide repeat protein [Kiritimatiellia bacterium]MDP6847622.1 tetratricopeptide repeat protein [Kiritimatiellia bacterium]